MPRWLTKAQEAAEEEAIRQEVAMAEPLREPGWWRLTEHGWEPVDDTMAEAEVAAGGGWNLIHVLTAAVAETPLF